MTASQLDIRVQDIDHCRIVAGICDEMNLVEQINHLLGTHSQRKSAGIPSLQGMGGIAARRFSH
ncbi:DUF4277 domain-containing protein [Nostoc sp.]|uniref:DUF4277 domain-containing protein n=1 Tax=Nostoc sp. TaxID=1180 RepID=UPI003FA5AEA4